MASDALEHKVMFYEENSSSENDDWAFNEDQAFPSNQDDPHRSSVLAVFADLRTMAVFSMTYFEGTADEANKRFYTSFCLLYEHLAGGVESGVEFLLNAAARFDYSPSQQGSGYRSLVTIVEKCCHRIRSLSYHIVASRESYFFNGDYYSRELESYVTCLGQLRACLYYLQKLSLYCPDGNLVPDEDALPPEEYQTAERLLKEVESLSQEAFYGRCLGFQYCPSMLYPLTTINLVMASYGDGFSHSSSIMQLAASLWNGTKYFMDAELRARQVVNMTRNHDIRFCKAFWSLAENAIMHKAPLFLCPAVEVDQFINIGSESVHVPLIGRSGVMEVLPLPDQVGIRVISARRRSKQEVLWKLQGKTPPSVSSLAASKYLVIHCHGGGFVAQSSASHEVYLRHWAKDLDCPMISVDYSLAPEHRFPCQLNEVFFAYCWALSNAHILGTTAEHVCLVGDSAGANLSVAIAMKASVSGIRQPDGILSVYGCLLMKYTPSPSRILALMDPLLSIGVLSLCLHAYADEATGEKDSALAHDNTRFIEKSTTVTAGLNTWENRTGAGIDKNQAHYVNSDYTCSEVCRQTVCPSGEMCSNSDTPKQRLLVKNGSAPSFRPAVLTISKTVGAALDKELLHLSTYAKQRHFAASPLENFRKGRVSQSPFVSPLLADDSLLKTLCPIHLMACHLDPMLDDSIMFAKRLRDLGNPVDIEFVSDLPHGFLNFSLMSPEAQLASKRCVQTLKRLLTMPVDG